MELQYKLVAESEADLKTGKISVSSPIGKGLLGKKVGETAEIAVPNGKITFEIVEITRNWVWPVYLPALSKEKYLRTSSMKPQISSLF